MPVNIENLYSEFRTTYQEKPDFVIDFFEKNSIYFKNIQSFNDKVGLRLYIEMISKYADANYQKGRYNVAADIVDKEQDFIDNEIDKLKAYDLKDNWYHSLQFVKGMATYCLKDYKTSVLAP